MKQKVIIGLGSNWKSEVHIQQANRLLMDYFDEIHFSEAVYTEPIGVSQSDLFLNQVAIAYTSHSIAEIETVLKEMEKMLGRTSTSKQQGIIPIDLDLLQWNNQILKSDDLERDYIRNGIESIIH